MKRALRPISSVGISLRLWVMVLGLITGSLVVIGAPPGWWQERGVLVTNGQGSVREADDYAAANQGQLKNMASHAVEEFAARLNKIPGWIGDTDNPDGTGNRLLQLY